MIIVSDMTPSLARVVMIFVLLLMVGCGSTQYRIFKSGASDLQTRQDSFDCKQMARVPFVVGTGGMMVGGSDPDWRTYVECLQARGYTVTIRDDEAEARALDQQAETRRLEEQHASQAREAMENERVRKWRAE